MTRAGKFKSTCIYEHQFDDKRRATAPTGVSCARCVGPEGYIALAMGQTHELDSCDLVGMGLVVCGLALPFVVAGGWISTAIFGAGVAAMLYGAYRIVRMRF